MDVFVIPVASDRYVLYYEQQTEETDPDEPESTGMLARFQRRFKELLREAEEHRHEGRAQRGSARSWTGRLQDHMMAWIARRVAEQRLLWNLRNQEQVVAVHPSDVEFEAVLPHIQQTLQRDFERHRFWLVVDTAGLIVSGLLAIVPGPNLIAYYFLFRAGGHFLSMRGAAQGRRRVTWQGRPCEPLNELREVSKMPWRDSHSRVQRIAATLHLRNLTTFFERVTAKNTQGAAGARTPNPVKTE
jgi:hypothetical protein